MSTNTDQLQQISDDLSGLMKQLGPRKIKAALRKTVLAEGTAVKRVAVQQLKVKGSSAGYNLKKVASAVYRKAFNRDQGIGFIVTAGFQLNPERGMTTNRRGLRKPLALWFNAGTVERETKGRNGKRVVARGRIQGVDAIEPTEKSEIPKVYSRIEKTFIDMVEKIARKALG